MDTTRTLRLRREALAELGTRDLANVAGAGAIRAELTDTGPTCLQELERQITDLIKRTVG